MNESSLNNDKNPQKVAPKIQNPLIEARYKLSIDEQKILFTLISRLVELKNPQDICVKIKQSELIAACHLKAEVGENIILNAVKGMRRRIIELEESDGRNIITGWITAAEFDTANDELCVFFDVRLRDKLINLQQNYSVAPTSLLMSFRHDYSPKFYAWLKSFPLGKRCTYSLDFFVVHFDLPESYKSNFTHFRRKFFEPCIKEINECSDIGAVYDYVKEGRAYTKINMAVATKHKVKFTRLSDQGKIGEGWTNKEKALLIVLTNPDKWGINKERAEELLLGYGADRIKRNLDYANINRKGKTNLADWLTDCIETDRAVSERAEIKTPSEETKITPSTDNELENINISLPEKKLNTTPNNEWRSDLQQLKNRLHKIKRKGNLPWR